MNATSGGTFANDRRCEHARPKAILIWEEVMPTLVGFGEFAALLEEQISEKISRAFSLVIKG